MTWFKRKKKEPVDPHQPQPEGCGSRVVWEEVEHWCGDGRGHNGGHHCVGCDMTWAAAIPPTAGAPSA